MCQIMMMRGWIGAPLAVRVQDQKLIFKFKAHGFDQKPTSLVSDLYNRIC